MRGKPFDFIRCFDRLGFLKPSGESKIEIRGGFSATSVDWLARRAVDNALSRVLFNIRGFDVGSVFPSYASYLSEPVVQSDDARKVLDSGYMTVESDVISAQRYYAANMICYAMRRYALAKSTVNKNVETDIEFRRTYLDNALEFLSLACERNGFSMQAALKRFAKNKDGHFTVTEYDAVQNLFYKELRDLLRVMTDIRMTNGVSSPAHDRLYDVIALMYKMTYNVDKEWFMFRCGHIYRMWGIKLRGECDFCEIPDAMR